MLVIDLSSIQKNKKKEPAAHSNNPRRKLTLVSDEIASVVHDETSDIFFLTDGNLLNNQLVEIPERHVHADHSRDPVEWMVERVLPVKQTLINVNQESG